MPVMSPVYGYDVVEHVDKVTQQTPNTSIPRPDPGQEGPLKGQPKVSDRDRSIDQTRAGCSFLHRVPGERSETAYALGIASMNYEDSE